MKRLVIMVLTMAMLLSLFPLSKAEQSYTFPWKGDEITLDYYYVDFRYTGRTYDKLIDDEFQKLIGNVKINDLSLGWADYGTKHNLYLSTGQLPDIIFGNRNLASQYAETGMFLDFTPYLDLMPNYTALAKRFPNTFVKVGDQILSIAQCRDKKINSKVWYVNENFRKSGKYSIPDTMNDLLEVLRAVKADYPTIYPLIGGWDGLTSQIMMQFDTRNSVFYNFVTSAWEYGPTNEGFKQYVEFMTTLYSEGLIAPDYVTYADVDDVFWNRFKDPNAWYIYSGYNEMYPATVKEMQAIAPDYYPTGILPPQADGHDRKIWTEAFLGQPIDGIYCSSKTKDPAFLAAFLDFLVSDQVGTLVNWGVEGVTFEYDEEGQKKYLDTLKLDSNPDVGSILPLADLGLTPHFMIKQMGLATKNDFIAMDIYSTSDEQMARQNMLTEYIEENPKSEVYHMPTPPFTPDENDEISIMKTDLDTYVDEQMQLFITGQRPLDQWDDFIAELNTLADIEGMLNVYNSYDLPIWVND